MTIFELYHYHRKAILFLEVMLWQTLFLLCYSAFCVYKSQNNEQFSFENCIEHTRVAIIASYRLRYQISDKYRALSATEPRVFCPSPWLRNFSEAMIHSRSIWVMSAQSFESSGEDKKKQIFSFEKNAQLLEKKGLYLRLYFV